MQYALMKDGIVRNVIEAESDFLPHIAADWDHIEALDTEGEQALNVGIGWGWDGSGFVEPPAQPQPEPLPPASVTMRQARLALLAYGILGSVDAAIDAMPEPDKSEARIEWDYSNEVQRHNGFVAQLGPVLGLTEAQLDNLFALAATL
jgi:hypothetical protein